MLTESDKKKILEDYKEGVDILVEVEKVEDPRDNPFKRAKVIKVIFPGDKSKNRDIFVEIERDDKKEKVHLNAISRICQDDSINVNDMVEVSPINTKDLLTNIKNRYEKDEIFTNVGETLIIVNPYYIIPGLYTKEKMQEIINHSNEYSTSHYERGVPHCFDTTMNTIFDLLNTRKNQALVISGESGAGKTECAKLCMRFIVYYFEKKSQEVIEESAEPKEEGISLETKILACNPVLEAFGNSKTVRNDNSSRFGKYIKIFINTTTKEIIGAYMETYLLEKSRVVSLASGERNYHIFYQVIIGINALIKQNFNYDKLFRDLSDMKLDLSEDTKSYITNNLTQDKIKFLFNLTSFQEISFESFNYLKNDVYTVPTINDLYNFYECIEGLVHAGFKDNEINYVIQIVVAILWCGNIEFDESPSKDSCTVNEPSKKIQDLVCQMLNIDPAIFSDAFLFNVRIIKGETIKSPMELKDCKAFRDTFSKEIYNRLFSYLVQRMNITLFDEKIRDEIETNDAIKHIGLLDIFGFECFKENSFEQFCINYANEKLQNLYVEDIFKEIELMFIREGLKEHFTKIEYKDNILILDAMGKYPSGIFFQLDNECNVGQSDTNLLSRILSTLKSNPSIKSSLKNPNKFFIIHTAKDVEYTINGFCVKNLDEFKLRMKDSMLSIKDKQILQMIGEDSGVERHKKEKFLGGKFRTDMDNLASALRQCVRHYIRCLKPNELKKKKYFVPWFSLLQIKYMGVLDTIRIRQEGFPVIKNYLDFYLKYEDAVDFPGKLYYRDVKEDNPNLKKWVSLITKTLIPTFTDDNILFGKTLVLVRRLMSDDLDAARKKALMEKEKMVTILANKIRGCNAFLTYKTFYRGLETLQQNNKLYPYINRMNKIRALAAILQKKSMMLKVKKDSEIFKGKLNKLKRFFSTSYFSQKFKDNYIKYLQVKYSLISYVNNFKLKKYAKYRMIIKTIIGNKILNHVKQVLEPKVIFLQKHIRSYLAKINMGPLYDEVVIKRKYLKEEIACRKIQKDYRTHLAQEFIRKLRIAKSKFIGLIKHHKFQTWYHKVRKAAITIQRAYLRKYLKRHIIEERLKEFTEEEDNRYEEANYVSNMNLFPGRRIEHENILGQGQEDNIGSGSNGINTDGNGNPNTVGEPASRESIVYGTNVFNRLKEAPNYFEGKKSAYYKKFGPWFKQKNYYDKKMMDIAPIEAPNAQYLNHSFYDDPKLHFFSHILDLDAIINIDDIYSIPWTETYAEVILHNIEQDTPIQLIEVGDFHTTLVNTNGKTFTWGWNGNGQCAFNTGNDTKYLFENFKPRTKEELENGNTITGLQDFKDLPIEIEGCLTNNFNFDEEIKNIQDEKEIFDEDEEDEDNFNKEKLTEFYYVDTPMIIDNFTVKKIACGDDNTMVLTKDDKLFVFGGNYDYQLGVLKSRNVFSPMQLWNIVKTQQANPVVNLKSKIKEMKFAGKNALLLNEDGNLIMLSCFNYQESANKKNKELGQSSKANKNKKESNKNDNNKKGKKKEESKQEEEVEEEEVPEIFKTPIELPIQDVKFSSLECGKDFCLLLAQNGLLYSMGSNKFGQLGVGDNEPRYYPTIIKFFKDKKIKVQQISCGFKHCCIKANSRAYTWGCNNNGQLGTKSIDNANTPVLVDIKYQKLNNNIMQVSCGFRSTVFLTETRRIFWCGTCGDIRRKTYPVEFFYTSKIPEIFGYDNHEIMKINHTWSKTMSILYAVVAETGPLKCKLNNPNKFNFILNSISNIWVGKSIYPPVIDQMEKFVAEKHIIRSEKKKKKN